MLTKLKYSTLTALAVLSLGVTPVFASSFADATGVIQSSTTVSACSSIDGINVSKKQWYRSFSDVAAKGAGTITAGGGGVCCTAASVFGNGVCTAKPVCTATQIYKTSSNTCENLAPPTPVLADCPAQIVAQQSSIVQLVDPNPSVLTPDGHQWCYYFGSNGGDEYSAAFDRVVGNAVSYYPKYQEKYFGMTYYETTNPVQCYDTSDNTSACSGGDVTRHPFPILGFDNTSFKGYIPVYGTLRNSGPQFGNLFFADGGTKCAYRASVGSAGDMQGYYAAWFPKDCRNGTNETQMHGTTPNLYPGGGWCFLDTAPQNPFRTMSGITRMKIGGEGGVGYMASPAGDGATMPLRGSYGGGCAPGLTTYVVPAPAAPIDDSSRGG